MFLDREKEYLYVNAFKYLNFMLLSPKQRLKLNKRN